jgi:hypothetical protein
MWYSKLGRTRRPRSQRIANRNFSFRLVHQQTNCVEVMMKEDKNRFVVKQRLNGIVVAKGKALISLVPNTDYRVKLKNDQATNTLQLFVDNVLVLTLNASPTGTGAPGLGVKGTTSTFAEIVVF